ncbi:MAG TPA: GAF domain-containing protein [Pyrinomonadaceae bacterium]|nr:GAF domain-containing protein [Pyrinomonadaceae bacterium]
MLEQLLIAGVDLVDAREEPQVLASILQGIQAVGLNPIRLYLLAEGRQSLVGTAHVGMDETFLRSEWLPTQHFLKQPTSGPYVYRRNDRRARFPKLAIDENVDELIWMPFVSDEKLLGGLLADNKIGDRSATEDELAALALFISQSAAAIKSVRMLSESIAKTETLKSVLEVSTKVNSSLDLERILNSTCQAAVELLGADHSGFVRFDENFEMGCVYAEFPEMGMVGDIIPLRDMPAGEEFIRAPKPFMVSDVATEPKLGPGREILSNRGICSTLIVPVLGAENRLLGSFGLDSIGNTRFFTDADIDACQIFADQVAVAIENSQRYEETQQQAMRIENLWRNAFANAPEFDRNAILTTIIQQAVALLGAKSGGIYEHYRESNRITVIADFNRQQNVGKTLKKGEGLAGRLVENNAPYMIIDDYDTWKGKSRIYSQGRHFGAVLEVPLKWKGETVGVLYIDDKTGRKFTPKDARLLGLFADHAAIVLVNADILAKDSEKLVGLTGLSQATEAIIRNLGRLPLEGLLTLVARFATQILRAESCAVFLASTKGYLTLEASYGHREGGFIKGKKLRIESGPGTGLTGHIAYQGELFNKHGTELTEHFAVRGDDVQHTPSAKCHSILAIPLKKKDESGDPLVGVLRIDNKKNTYDQALPELAFTAEDEWILGIFAEAVVVAIESSMFIDQIGKQKDNWTRFLDSAATGIIANDARGNITLYNKQAEQILGYSANEVLYTKVDRLYFDPQEARKIGKLLQEDKSSKITNYDTFVRSKDGTRLLIRLSATRLFDDGGHSIGSVGYFDPATPEIQTLLETANEIIAKAENQTEGLQRLAEMILSLIPHTFCRILLFDESKKSLQVEAAHPIPRDGEDAEWKLKLTTPIVASQWSGLDTILVEGKPEIIRLSDKRFRFNLIRLSRLLGFAGNIQSLLIIPLVIEKESFGFVELGELRSLERSSFPQREVGLIAKVAAQVTMLILLYRITNRNKEEFEHLHRAATAMAGAFDLKQVLQTIVVQAREMLGADSSSFWSYDHAQDKFIPEEMVAAGIPQAEMKRFRREAPRPGRTAYTVLRKNWIGVPDVSSTKPKFIGPTTRALLQRMEVTSFQGIALKAGGEPVGVLYVNYKHPRTFGQADRAALENFAAYAALSLKRARLDNQVRNEKRNVETVTNLMALGDRDATLRSVIKGTSTVLKCDAVTLYAYDHARKRFDYPPKIDGIWKPRGVTQREDLPADSIVYTILRRNKPYIAERVRDNKLFKGREFVEREGIESCAAIPLRAAGEKVGVMFVNYRSRHRFTREEIDSIQLFADQAAIALSNAQLYEQSRKRAEALDGLYRAGRAVTGSLSLQKTLERITQQALIVVGISEDEQRCFSHVLFRVGDDLRFMAASSPRGASLLRRTLSKINLAGQGRTLGIAGRAAKTGTPQNVGDVRDDPDYNRISFAIRSQLSVPLKIGKVVTGVLSIEHHALNAFSDEDLKNIELLAAQAAIAIENAESHEDLQHLHQAATTMAGAFGLKQVLRTIVKCAKDMLEADSAAIWSYDQVHDRFIADEMVAIGIPESELKRFRKEEPKPGRTAYTVLKKKWVGVPNLEVDFLGSPTKDFLRRVKVSSFEGIALRAGDEPVGVLYVNYKQPRTFTAKDRRALENFAAYAALSLKRARLLDQLRTGQTAAEAVAYQMALGDWDASLLSITGATLDVLDSDASTLYVCDPVTRKLKHPPTNVGLRNRDHVLHSSGIADNSIAYEMLQQPGPYGVEKISDDPLFKDSRFAREEGIVSCVAIPIGMSEEKLGVMFVNYRRHHPFTEEEIGRIRLFSLQAAVAISNAQRYDDAQRRSRVLAGLYTAGREIASSLDSKRTLQAITHQALRIVGPTGKRKGSFSHLALKTGNTLKYISSSSKKILKTLSVVVDFNQKTRRLGIAGRVARTGEAKNVGNVKENDDYNELSDSIQSQLSVPLKIGKRVIGVLSIEHPELNAFSSEDQKNIELLAAQAAVAVDHARQFKDLKETKGVVGSLTALAFMGMANNVWRHEIDGYASTMRLALKRLRAQIQKAPLRPGQGKDILERLETIESQANKILTEPFPAPLSDDEGSEPVLINDLVNDRLKQLQESGLLPSIKTRFSLTKDDTTIFCSNDWLTRAFDIVIDNAIRAMASSKRRVFTISTRTADGMVRVIFKDTGKGIPRGIRRKVLRERIKKPMAKGMGMGLLMLQAIVQAYDGDATVASSGAEGTTIVLQFPHRARKMRSSHE